MSTLTQYRLGLPAWAYPGWEGKYFNDGSTRLADYAEVFNCVEGNTTFYSIPSERTVAQWAEMLTGRDFHFCFKLPREITHGGAGPETEGLNVFLKRLEPVYEYLGPFFVQLPATVGPTLLPEVKKLLASFPPDFSFAVEVRHPDFFETPERFDEALAETGCYRVIMDARPIHREQPDHPEVKAARHEKPDLPVYARQCNGGVMVRLVYHPDEQYNQRYTEQWISSVHDWIANGDKVYMMIHCPNNLYCPGQAERFHGALQAQIKLPDLAPWPLRQGQLF